MTTVAEIDRVQALVKRLRALGNAQRGDLIRAQQWNDLVGMVVEVAQAVLDTSSEDVPPHEHPDQVKTTWLAPSLRSLVERGPLSDPAATSRVTDVETRIRALADDIDRISGTVTGVRDRISEMSTRELTRESDTNELRLTVGSLVERRDEVLELRKTLGSIGERVDKALEASSRLVIGGKPVDMNELDRRILAVEEIRDSLTGPNGQLLDATEFERRLSILGNTLVTQEQLEQALKERPIELGEDTLEGIGESVAVKLREETKITFATLSTEIRNETEAKLTGVDALVGQRIEERLPERVEVEAEKLRTESKEQIEAAFAAAREENRSAIEDATGTLRGEITQRIGEVQAGVPGRVSTELANLLPGILLPLEENVAAARAQATALLTRVDELTFSLQDARARVEQVAFETAQEMRITRDSLLSEIDRREALQREANEVRFQEIEGRLDQRLTSFDSTVLDLRASLREELTAAAVAAANESLRVQLVQLQAQMEEIARSQTFGLQDQVTESVIKQLNSFLDVRIAEITRDQFSGLQEEISSSIFKQVDADLDRRVTDIVRSMQ